MATAQNQTDVHAQLKNELAELLKLDNTHDWSGKVADNYPSLINPHQTEDFEHDGQPPHGSKAAVIYDLFPINNVACVIAWWFTITQFDPKKPWVLPTTVYKVYVETGPKENYANPDWDAMEQKLNNEGGPSSESTDDKTKTKVAATINDKGELNVTFAGVV